MTKSSLAHTEVFSEADAQIESAGYLFVRSPLTGMAEVLTLAPFS
jgi:hypothetical protein